MPSTENMSKCPKTIFFFSQFPTTPLSSNLHPRELWLARWLPDGPRLAVFSCVGWLAGWLGLARFGCVWRAGKWLGAGLGKRVHTFQESWKCLHMLVSLSIVLRSCPASTDSLVTAISTQFERKWKCNRRTIEMQIIICLQIVHVGMRPPPSHASARLETQHATHPVRSHN